MIMIIEIIPIERPIFRLSVSRMNLRVEGEYGIFSSLFIGSMIEIASCIDIGINGEYNDSMVTDV